MNRRQWAIELMIDADDRGVILSVVGGKLKWRAPVGIVTQGFLILLSEYKQEIITLLEPPPKPKKAARINKCRHKQLLAELESDLAKGLCP